MVLNIAEGCDQAPEGAEEGATWRWPERSEGLELAMRGGKAGLNHYRIALGSAGECCAALDVVEVAGGPAMQAKLRRVGAMLWRMKGGR